ncbi:SRPBCC family protein [Aquimarina sp. AD10]|uniref:SRPBCC family protein n=1 Tax=Aquimarina sp. AD10 TaxID=1714849 RepID=UPI000E4EA63D|nr:SRPBCC family protein [Aquimarina sp. AD10]AXT59225.1 SRPBCC family protein [Aquimarina sp. AD10]RKM92715.1 SRPBCC family protein [Aquimarina sp. AD10]
MKITIKSIVTLAMFTLVSTIMTAQSMEKKFRTVKVEMKIDAPAERVWEVMVLDYGEISNFSPYIYTSEYTNGSLNGKLGAERKCNFNEKGTQWSKERIAEIDSENMVMRNLVIDGAKLPLNFDNSQAFYRVKDNGDGTSTASYEFQFRTKPAFLAIIAKGGFKKQMSGTLVGLKHYIETRERVTGGTNKYKEIKKRYPKATIIKT